MGTAREWTMSNRVYFCLFLDIKMPAMGTRMSSMERKHWIGLTASTTYSQPVSAGCYKSHFSDSLTPAISAVYCECPIWLWFAVCLLPLYMQHLVLILLCFSLYTWQMHLFETKSTAIIDHWPDYTKASFRTLAWNPATLYVVWYQWLQGKSPWHHNFHFACLQIYTKNTVKFSWLLEI